MVQVAALPAFDQLLVFTTKVTRWLLLLFTPFEVFKLRQHNSLS